MTDCVECYNTKTIALNMGLTILDGGSKYGPRNTIKFFSLIVQSTSDSTAAKAKMNNFLNICLLLEFIKDR